MLVKELMTGAPATCRPETNLGAAVEILWNRNCGFLPVVDAEEKVIGVVTDRDICIAMGTHNRLPGDLSVGEIATRRVFTCGPEDEIHEALYTMANKQVRRLPVVNKENVLEGVLSMDDVVTHGDLNKWEGCCELSAEEIIRSLKKLYGRQFLTVHTRAAAA